jgi:hypothetical protein
MEFNLIYYKIFKVKYMLKFTPLFFFFNSTRLKSRNWVFVEQSLKAIKLSYYKVYNISTNSLVNHSIFKNGNKLLVNGTTLFVDKNTNKDFPLATKLANAHPLLVFLSTKINNRIYSNFQIQTINFSSYNQNLLILNFLLKINLKKQLTLNFNSCFYF